MKSCKESHFYHLVLQCGAWYYLQTCRIYGSVNSQFTVAAPLLQFITGTYTDRIHLCAAVCVCIDLCMHFVKWLLSWFFWYTSNNYSYWQVIMYLLMPPKSLVKIMNDQGGDTDEMFVAVACCRNCLLRCCFS